MSLIVPAAMETVLREADDSSTPLDEGDLWSKQIQAAPDPKLATADERLGAFAEIAAWRFMRPHGTECEPWGIYWGPLTSGILADGTTHFYNPDVAEVNQAILEHWINRAASAKHPVVKARYADLAWEIGRYLKRSGTSSKLNPKEQINLDIPVNLAQTAIDAYLSAIELELVEDEYHSWQFIERALGLAISLNDQPRIGRAKTILFGYSRKLAGGPTKFMWWRLDDIASNYGKALTLGDDERKEIVDLLETVLARCSDIKDTENFDPHMATNAADHLTRRLGSAPEEIRRIVKRAAGAFEEIAKEATGILAVSWLEDLIPRYRNAGLIEDAARVERAIRARAEEARGEMKQVSVPIKIESAELEKWIVAVIGSNLKEALGQIALHCMLREDRVQRSLKDMLETVPLLSSLTATVMGDEGFTTATIHSVEKDLEGRAIQRAADMLAWESQFLNFALNRAQEKYSYDLEALVAHINGAPIFAPNREPVLREGLAAWLTKDAVKAIHVLVPQVEAACRDLLVALGAPVMKHDTKSGGFEVIGMGAVINHPAFRKGVPPDIRFHLRALYSDSRGINLRNHLAHGMAHIGLMNIGLANWVVHSILLLASLRISQKPGKGSPTIGD